jgi:hypothetical protein
MIAPDEPCLTLVRRTWSGDAAVTLVVLQAGTSDTTRIELHTSTKFATQATYKDLIIRLQKLDPYPHKDTRIQVADYVATLAITRQ